MTTPEITAIFEATGWLLTDDRAQRMAAVLRSTGGDLNRAIEGASVDCGLDLLADLLTYRQALKEAADPAMLAARLIRQAESCDWDEGKVLAMAASDSERADYCRSRNDPFAVVLDGMADTGRRQAASYRAESLRLRALAASVLENAE